MAGDATGADIDGADNVTVGKHNVQQVVNVGHDEAHRDAEETHVITVRLLNDWLGRFEKRMDRESEERRKELDALRHEMDEMKRMVSDMANRFGHAIRLPYGHMQIFGMAFVMLWAPTPLFLSDVRNMFDVSWAFAAVFTVLCYLVSAFLWGYLWFGGGRS
jgi:hypothetical protein